MRKFLVRFLICLICSMCFCAYSVAQTYVPIDVVAPERTRTEYKSSDGIKASITIDGDQYVVKLFNSNYNDPDDNTYYSFKWFLSYKGKRVSDYFSEKMGCRDTEIRRVYAWPNKVPSGNAKYVTVQLKGKDRRD